MHTHPLIRQRLGQTPPVQAMTLTATASTSEPLLTRALRLQRHPLSILLALGLGVALTSTPMHARVSQTREDAMARREYQTQMAQWIHEKYRDVDREYAEVVAMRNKRFQEGGVSRERLDRVLADDAKVWEAKRRDVEDAQREGKRKLDEWMKSRGEGWARKPVRVVWPGPS